MTPGAASAAGVTLQIFHPDGGPRVAAHVFDLDVGGIAYVDSGWTDPWSSSHTAHVLQGLVESVDATSWLITLAEDEVAVVHNEFQPESLEGARELARHHIEIDLGVTLGGSSDR